MSEASMPAVPPPATSKKNKYGWIGFFAFVVIASVSVASLMIWYNRMIQLTPEQLQAAEDLWKTTNLRDYKMVYSKRINANPEGEKFTVQVRAGKVEEVLLNGKPLGTDAEHDLRPYHSMDRLFHDIERFMQLDAMPNKPKVYVIADFDPKTGAIRRYIRRVMGSQERLEITARIEATGK